MSIQVMNAVWQHSKADGRARLVLLAIADHQGEIGAWPSIATLAKMVNSSERSVQRDIQHLQAIGELKVEVQNAPTKSQYKSNLYWVILPGVTAGVTESSSGVTDSASGVTAGGVQTLIEPLLETHTPKPSDLFDEFWKEYPRKEGKKPAFKAFRSALSRAKFEDILAGVIAYRSSDRVKRGYIKLPATWLNEDLWEDAATLVQIQDNGSERRAKEKQESQAYLEQMRELEKQAAPPPPHIRKALGL